MEQTQIHGISRNGQNPYLLAAEWDWLVPHLHANRRREPTADWQILSRCSGCDGWFLPIELDGGFHSEGCRSDAEEGWAVDFWSEV